MSSSNDSAGGTPPSPQDAPSSPPQQVRGDVKAYWRANITFVAILLVIWFTVSCVLSIFAVNWLNQFQLGGFPLGFWFAQQGSVIIFILLILTYAIGMGIMDRHFGVAEEATPEAESAEAEAGAAE